MSLENKQGCFFAIADPIKSDYIFRRDVTLLLFLPCKNPDVGRACGAREHRPLSIRNDFRGWFYPPTFLISATRPPRYRDSGATLRRFELRGEPRVRPNPGIIPKRDRALDAGKKRRGGGVDRRGRIDKKGRGIERVSSRCLFFTSRKSHAPDAHPTIPNSINMAPLNNGRWIRPAFLERFMSLLL